MNDDRVVYLESFGVEHIPKQMNKFIGSKNIKISICEIQAFNLIMCVFFCIGSIDFMLKSKCLLDYTNLFFPNKCKK